MKPQELRIGNYIQTEPDGFKSKVYSINTASMMDLMNELQVFGEISNIFPIPLTEKWLLDFGSEEVNGEHFIDCGEYVLRVAVNAFSGTLESNSKWFVSITTKENLATITIVYEYVHQLQNLYFALTGKELTK